MRETKIPYLHCRNGIYYYRNQSVWKLLRTRCKKEAFSKISHILFGTMPVASIIKFSFNNAPITPLISKLNNG